MTRFILIVCVVFCGLVIGSFWIFHRFGSIGSNLHFTFLFGLILFVGWLMTRFSRMKGRALKGAEVTIHSVKAVPPPSALKAGDLDDPARYYVVDFSVTPAPSVSRQPWRPEEFSLTTPGESVPAHRDDEEGEADLHELELWNGTEFCRGKPGEVSGPQRLRATFSIETTARSACLEYFSETWAKFELPSGG